MKVSDSYEGFALQPVLYPSLFPALSYLFFITGYTQALMKERTVAAAMTLRLKKSTQAELIAGMGKLKGGGLKGASAQMNLPLNAGRSFFGAARTGMHSASSSPRAASPMVPEKESHNLSLEAFASSLSQEPAAKPPSLKPMLPLPGGDPPASIPSGGKAPSAWQDLHGGGDLLFEVELWRSDLLTSVLELDVKGNLVGGGLAYPLCPPGETP